jgi:uracil-DNA glycosylase
MAHESRPAQAFLEALSVLESKLRFRRSAGGDRLPSELAERMLGLLAPGSSFGHGREAEDTLKNVATDLTGCARCTLHRTRRTVVVGEGNLAARLMFVGEGPGEEEDAQGRPFVGPAGQLLAKIIQAMGFQREEVYIANVVKCRPPANRAPKPDEIAACRPFLMRQIRIISPKVICALGGVASQTLLQTTEGISRLRGRFHPCEGVLVMPTYHPSYLLRNPEKKRDVWEDMKKVMVFLREQS